MRSRKKKEEKNVIKVIKISVKCMCVCLHVHAFRVGEINSQVLLQHWSKAFCLCICPLNNVFVRNILLLCARAPLLVELRINILPYPWHQRKEDAQISSYISSNEVKWCTCLCSSWWLFCVVIGRRRRCYLSPWRWREEPKASWALRAGFVSLFTLLNTKKHFSNLTQTVYLQYVDMKNHCIISWTCSDATLELLKAKIWQK